MATGLLEQGQVRCLPPPWVANLRDLASLGRREGGATCSRGSTYDKEDSYLHCDLR